MTIDLHGMTENEAIGAINSTLMSVEMGTIDEVTIITGNGMVLKDVAIEIIHESGLTYRIDGNNYGALIVTK